MSNRNTGKGTLAEEHTESARKRRAAFPLETCRYFSRIDHVTASALIFAAACEALLGNALSS